MRFTFLLLASTAIYAAPVLSTNVEGQFLTHIGAQEVGGWCAEAGVETVACALVSEGMASGEKEFPDPGEYRLLAQASSSNPRVFATAEAKVGMGHALGGGGSILAQAQMINWFEFDAHEVQYEFMLNFSSWNDLGTSFYEYGHNGQMTRVECHEGCSQNGMIYSAPFAITPNEPFQLSMLVQAYAGNFGHAVVDLELVNIWTRSDEPTSIPEPAQLLLIGSGLIAVYFTRRRK